MRHTHDVNEKPIYRQDADEAALIRHTSRTAWATIVIAVASSFAFGAAIFQYLVFSAQLDEMKSASADTRNLANAAVRQADAAQQMAKINIETYAALIEAQRASEILAFGGKKVTTNGRKAHELYATLAEVGVPAATVIFLLGG